ncbi:MAG: HD domain-containing protein [Negativicutes bacterium]|nr:HD domain-containing protein [Negativicutes bacterium]
MANWPISAIKLMLNRVKQVIAALTAKVTAADRGFIRETLRAEEQALFYAMNLPDQRHSLNVAYTALEMAEGRAEVDRGLLLKSALLHDVGKIKGDVSTLDKILTVLAHRIAPCWAEGWGQRGRGGKVANLRHAFHTYFHHPERSAELLAAVGVEQEIIGIIRRHHAEPQPDDQPELILLRQADDLH